MSDIMKEYGKIRVGTKQATRAMGYTGLRVWVGVLGGGTLVRRRSSRASTRVLAELRQYGSGASEPR